jgi:secondary thiamine-phosphate synthase enzyme
METLCLVRSELLSVRTEERLQLVDVTPRIVSRLRRADIRDGIALVSSMHTTFSIFINEFQPALLEDIKTFLEQAVPRDSYWKHNDPRYSDCDRMNADAHLRAALLGHSVTVPIKDGELGLGTFQSVIAAELDGPRQRALNVQFMGV